jgi:DNA polymerase-3 subunit epsilon
LYAIVDIETTGSYAAANGITEICIIQHDGEKVTGVFESLVNPGQPIPRYIQAMTGITDEMVSHAPRFESIAAQVYGLLENRVFVAHNVNFDYSFVLASLRECGYDLKDKKLCTVRLSRKIFPGQASYSLGNLCRSLGIQIQNRHRAGGDTRATAELFHLLVRNDREEHIRKSLERGSKEYSLPPHVSKEDFDRLPYTPGVYYFHNAKGKVIYVGKARNIRYRVNSHFSNNSAGRQKQRFLQHIHSISYESCGTELMACILESVEIRKRWPAFNHAQKRWEDIYGLFAYEDQRGFLRLAIDKTRNRLNPVYSFHYLADGQAMLRKLVREFRLCPVLSNVQKRSEDCQAHRDGNCNGACRGQESVGDYNERVQVAMESLKTLPSFAIIDQGLNGDDRSCVLVKEGKFIGMGYLPPEIQVVDPSGIEDFLTGYRENSFIRNMVFGYAARFPSRVIHF